MNKVAQDKLEPGQWYWWIFRPAGDWETEFHKFCVVRAFASGRAVCLNIGPSLAECESFYVGDLGGEFYGPVACPIAPDFQTASEDC